MWTIVCFLTFLLWYVSLCLLSQFVIVFSTYFICCSNLQSNQITSITSGIFNDLLICKYQINSIFHVFTFKTWICLVNIPFYIERFSVKCDLKWRFKPWWSTIPSISTKECLCQSHASTLISNAMCPGLYCSQWFWGQRWLLLLLILME